MSFITKNTLQLIVSKNIKKLLSHLYSINIIKCIGVAWTHRVTDTHIGENINIKKPGMYAWFKK